MKQILLFNPLPRIRGLCLKSKGTILSLLTLFAILFSSEIANAQSGTVTFSAADFASLSAILHDGNYSSTDISGIQLNIFGATSPTNAANRTSSGTLFQYNTSTTINANPSYTYGAIFSSNSDNIIVIASNDGSEFSFKSIYVSDVNSSASITRFEGFKDGTSTGYVDLGPTTSSTFDDLFTSTDFPTSKFGNIDEIRITNQYGGNMANGVWIGINAITIGAAVLPAPTVTSVSVPSNKTYKTGDALTFTVNFDQVVTVTGTPQLSLSLNTGGTVRASYTGGSGSTALTFSYTVQSGNQDNDGLTVGSLGLNGGTIKNSGNTAANLTLNSVASTSGVKVDGVAPTVTSVSSSTAEGSYKAGSTIAITVAFSEVVTVTGTPTIALNSGGTASYSSGSNSNILTFNYTVASGENSSDLDYSTTSSLSLNSGTISDGAGNAATLTLPTVGGASSLGGQKNIIVDNVAPTVTLSSTASEPTNVSPIPVTITFSESVTGFDASDITVSNGTKGTLSGSGTTYSIDVTPSAAGTVTINVAAGVAADAAGNSNTAATQLSRTFDNVAPTVTLSSTASEPTNVSPIPVTITFSESVTGFDASDITVSNGTKGTLSGSGTTYSIDVTPSAAGTVTINVAAGVATDAAGNSNTAATQLARTFDNVAPTVSLSSTASEPTNVSPIPVTITFSESVTGFDASDITVSNGTKGTLSGSGTTYSIDVTPSAAGTVTINVAAGVAADAAGNSNTAASSLTRNYITVPDAPIIGTAAAGDGQAIVTFTAPSSDGGSPITVYTVTSNTGGFVKTGSSSPITITGLTNNTTYTFTVTATNGVGPSAASAPSNEVTPSKATGIDDAKLDGVTIYPNPVDDRLYIKGVDEGEIAVYDMGGCKVISAILANAQAVDVSGLAKGVYTVRITTSNGRVEKKLVKK